MSSAWMRRVVAMGVTALGLAAGAVSASAGTYDVFACSIDGGQYPNHAWVAQNNPAGDGRYVTDTVCNAGGDPLTVQLANGNTFGPGTFAALYFFAPPGASITDYKVAFKHYWYAPPSEQTYTLLSFGDTFFSGTGLFRVGDQDALNAEGHWYGYRGAHASGAAETGVITSTRSDSRRALAAPAAPYMTVSAGCYTDGGTDCSLQSDGAGNPGTVFAQLYGARVTVSDDSAPSLSGAAPGEGLFAPGTRSGGESVEYSASDNVGIRKAELVDVTDAANPRVVATRDYNAGAQTPAGERCDFTRPLPCPTSVTKDRIAADPPIAGRRTILVRVTDAAGNATVSAPTAIYARGPVNGTGATDTARVVAGFPAKVYRRSKAGKRYYTYVLRPSRTVSYGNGATLRGILRNSAGAPIGDAELRILVRENRLGAQYVDRGAVRTGADGRFAIALPKGASRAYLLVYRAYLGDDNPAARTKAALNTRARITARASRHVRARGRALFRGTLVGRPLPRRGVTLELQAYQPHRGWRTVATTRTRKAGHYRVRYRFSSPRGRFTFRVRLRPSDAYPYARSSSRRMRVRVG